MNILQVMGLVIIEHLLDEEVNSTIKISFFRGGSGFLAIERFREVLDEHFLPGGLIRITQDILKLKKRERSGEFQLAACLVELG